MPSELTGIHFNNSITETPNNNVMTYEYFYNGGGLAVGDVNNDGYSDLYFSGNMVENKLYLNKGNWKFEDITSQANIRERADWKTGVSVADVNGDGWLDVYICYSGNAPREGYNKPVIIDYPKRANQLFINNGCEKGGIPTFTERAKEFGIDAPGTFSTQAYFFDFDLDGDQDLFLLNHANMFYSVFHNVKRLRNLRHPYFGNKLYRNDTPTSFLEDTSLTPPLRGVRGVFTEVSDEAGIHGSGLNFGLSAAISDLNGDQWPDIYVGNDYDEQDFCYINNRDGTFKEVSHTLFQHISKSSMGSDIADINNDGLVDIFVADMLPEDNYRLKSLKGPEGYSKYKMAVDSGYHHQFMRNMLHLNVGLNSDSLPRFSEIGQIAGIPSTDWSWAPLFADFDNDGLKDLFITNGYLRDFTNLDFMQFTVRNAVNEANDNNHPVDLLALIQKIPSTKLSNYAFRNNDGFHFINQTKTWGLSRETISNAAVYADLDNDGDYDLIVNNINDDVILFQNHQDKIEKNNYIKIKLQGNPPNTFGIGAKVLVTLNDKRIFQENYFARGYQSTVEPLLTMGIGRSASIKEIKVIWPDSRISLLSNVSPNQLLIIEQKHASEVYSSGTNISKPLLKDVTKVSGLDFRHIENPYTDFDYQGLLLYQLSRLGGKLAVADVNGDGNDDIFFGGAAGQSGVLYYGYDDGSLVRADSQPWESDKKSEDQECLFFDVDNDNDLDLYVVSGGNEFLPGDSRYRDRLYINNGKDGFSKSDVVLSSISSGGCVAAADYDKDGDIDLFVGGRLVPQKYPLIPESVLLRNDTKGKTVKFTDVTLSINESLKKVGMVTDAVWADVNNDSWQDLMLVGDWMPVRIFLNKEGKFTEATENSGLKDSNGWWRKIFQCDIDEDGDVDFLLGNAGTNLQLQASVKEPLTYYVQDIDKDGAMDPILCYYEKGKNHPFVRRDELLRQVAPLRKKFVTYSEYADATIEDILKDENISTTYYLSAKTLGSSFLKNESQGKFDLKSLPEMAQISMVNCFVRDDFDGDGSKEVLVAGNFFPYNTQLGNSDASTGLLLKFTDEKFLVYKEDSPLWLMGDIRDMEVMKFNHAPKRIVISRNNDYASLFEFTGNKSNPK